MSDSMSAGVIGRNALWSMLNQSVGQILALGVFLIIARFVSKDAFGVMAISMLAVEFFRQILIESVGISLAAKRNPSDQDYNAGFIIILAGSVLAAILMYVLAGPVSALLKNADIEPALHLTSLVLLAMGLSRIPETWMAKNMRFKLLAIRSILAVSIGGTVGIYMAIHDYGLMSLIVQQILTSLLSLIFLWISSPWRPSFRTTYDHIKGLLSYSRHVSMNSLTGVLGAQSDIFFASYYLGAAATGVYNASKRILVATQLMTTSGINNVALPVFSTYADDPDGLKKVYLNAVGLTAFVMAPLYVGLAVMSEDIISIVLGTKWLDVAPVLSILTVTAFMSSIDQYNTNILLVRKKPHWQTIITVLNAIINLLGLFIWARYGLYYLAGALVIRSFLLFPLSLNLALRLSGTKLTEYMSTMLPVITSALLMGISTYYLKYALEGMSSIVNLAILVPAGVLLYGGTAYLLKRDMIHDIWRMTLLLIHKK